MKQIVFEAIPSGLIQNATVINGQLHAIVEDKADHSEAICAIQWDGQAAFVEVLKGDLTMPKLQFLGWPTREKGAIEALPVEDAPIELG